jgi:hypothetical protein
MVRRELKTDLVGHGALLTKMVGVLDHIKVIFRRCISILSSGPKSAKAPHPGPARVFFNTQCSGAGSEEKATYALGLNKYLEIPGPHAGKPTA